MSEIIAQVVEADPVQVAKDAQEYADRIKAESDALAIRLAAREALLERLGLTEEEAQLLLGGN